MLRPLLALSLFASLIAFACSSSSSSDDDCSGTAPIACGVLGCDGNTLQPTCISGEWKCIEPPCIALPPDAGPDSASDASSDAAPSDSGTDAGVISDASDDGPFVLLNDGGTCPSQPPTFGTSCDVDAEPVTCSYGPGCPLTCDCNAGSWRCVAAPCPPPMKARPRPPFG